MPLFFSQGDEGPPGPRGPAGERVRKVKLKSVLRMSWQKDTWNNCLFYSVSGRVWFGWAGRPNGTQRRERRPSKRELYGCYFERIKFSIFSLDVLKSESDVSLINRINRYWFVKNTRLYSRKTLLWESSSIHLDACSAYFSAHGWGEKYKKSYQYIFCSLTHVSLCLF